MPHFCKPLVQLLLSKPIMLWGLSLLFPVQVKAITVSFPNMTSNISLSSPRATTNTTSFFLNSTDSTVFPSDPETTSPPVIATMQDFCHGGPSNVDEDELDPYWYVPDYCHVALTSSLCAWRNSTYWTSSVFESYASQSLLTTTSNTIESATKTVEGHMVTEAVVAPQSLFTTNASTLTFRDRQFTDGTLITRFFTFTPGTGCCGECTISGGNVQVYFWPTTALVPPVSELVDRQGFVL